MIEKLVKKITYFEKNFIFFTQFYLEFNVKNIDFKKNYFIKSINFKQQNCTEGNKKIINIKTMIKFDI